MQIIIYQDWYTNTTIEFFLDSYKLCHSLNVMLEPSRLTYQ